MIKLFWVIFSNITQYSLSFPFSELIHGASFQGGRAVTRYNCHPETEWGCPLELPVSARFTGDTISYIIEESQVTGRDVRRPIKPVSQSSAHICDF